MRPVENLTAEVETARAVLRDARQVVVLTGAGISTDSGIPDFRGPRLVGYACWLALRDICRRWMPLR
ncbi:MAG: hypothetical protein OXT07_03400 [bacterium]|nr:hypothetical protein [bacterium]